MILLFSLSVMVLVFLLFYGMIQREMRAKTKIHQRMDSIRDINQESVPLNIQEKQKAQQKGFVERALKPAAEYLENTLNKFTPKAVRNLFIHRLMLAGKAKTWTVQQFFTTCVLAAVIMSGLMFLLLEHAKYALIQKVMFLILGGLFGGFMPIFCLNAMIQKRQQAILQQLPSVLDLLCVSVQAGLSFDAALNKIVSRMNGPFIDECQRLLDDTRMGVIRRTAMKNLAVRCDLQEVSLFMTSLIQAERLGSSMSKTLRNQADNMRERSRQNIKAKAMKAPIKIIFPLVLFIFPALFVVILVPPLLTMMKNM